VSDWVEWKGGNCPVSDGTLVEARLRYRIHTSDPIKVRAPHGQWVHTRGPNAECEDGFCQGNGDIIEYRVVDQPA